MHDLHCAGKMRMVRMHGRWMADCGQDCGHDCGCMDGGRRTVDKTVGMTVDGGRLTVDGMGDGPSRDHRLDPHHAIIDWTLTAQEGAH